MPRYQRFADKPSLSKLLRGADGMSREERDALITEAVLKHGCSQVEIADHLGLHYSTVSRIVGREK